MIKYLKPAVQYLRSTLEVYTYINFNRNAYYDMAL